MIYNVTTRAELDAANDDMRQRFLAGESVVTLAAHFTLRIFHRADGKYPLHKNGAITPLGVPKRREVRPKLVDSRSKKVAFFRVFR
jgi:hypothetical protein